MTVSSRLLLIGASGLAAQPLPPTVVPSGYSFLYSAGARTCIDLAASIGDRLWLTPRLHPGLEAPASWQELLLSHRNHGVIGVVPAGALADGYKTVELADLELRFDRERRTLELSLRGEPL